MSDDAFYCSSDGLQCSSLCAQQPFAGAVVDADGSNNINSTTSTTQGQACGAYSCSEEQHVVEAFLRACQGQEGLQSEEMGKVLVPVREVRAWLAFTHAEGLHTILQRWLGAVQVRKLLARCLCIWGCAVANANVGRLWAGQDVMGMLGGDIFPVTLS